MLKGIDHLVVLVADLDAAVRDYTALGFTVFAGGQHGGGTHNALIPFQDGAYIELIAFQRRSPEHRWWKWEPGVRGFIDYCLVTDDLDSDRARFGEAGAAIGEPRALTRKRPDGFQLHWEIAVPVDPLGTSAPFLIRDGTPRSERVPAAPAHRNGVRGVATLTIAARDPDAVGRWASAMPGLKVEPLRSESLQAAGLRVTVGPTELEFLSPLDDRSPIATVIGQQAPVTFAIGLDTGGSMPRFEPTASQGVRLAAVR
ncbi:MAG: VOC family protein [Lautropia sp.]